MLPLILGLLLAAAAAPYIYDDPAADQAIRRALDATYNLELQDARRTARSLQSRFPDHPVGYLMDAETYWWEAQTNPGDEAVEDSYFSTQEKAVKVGEQALKTGKYPAVEINAYLASAHGSKARFELTQHGPGFGTIRSGMRAHDYAEKVFEADPNYTDILVGIGAYNYFADRVPAIIKPFAWLFGAGGGNAELGLQQIRTAMERGRYAKTEAKIVYFTALLKDKQYPEALRTLESMMSDYPNNYALYAWATQWHREQKKDLEGADYMEKLAVRKLPGSPRLAQYALFEKAQLQQVQGQANGARQTLVRIRSAATVDPELTRRIAEFEKSLR